MAFSNLFGFGKIKVKSYSIDQREVLATGAFGVVFKGSDAKKNTIAAKRIDGNLHPRILTQELNKFLYLDHPNVLKILDIEKKGNIVWMMMPFCELGDLNQFYKTREVSSETKIEEMKQIAAGINYLHSQDIIHRDIKPGNILVGSNNPLRIILTDFDVSKCLDPEVETSLMTSNVGTLAFKAPEFFQRTSPGKIEYHRNVDIYAAGLTFLAILQAEKGKKMLVPQIETPMDDTDLHVPSIGQLVSERIKYNVSGLSILKIEGPHRSLKWLISRMTYVNPEERLTAEEVLIIIRKLKVVEAGLTSERPTFGCEVTRVQVPGLQTAAVNRKGQILARVMVNNTFHIKVLDRFGSEVISDIHSKCTHVYVIDYFACLIRHPTNTYYVLESCALCAMIRNYNIQTGECKIVYRCKRLVPFSMCHGPNDSILVYDHINLEVFELKWGKELQELHSTGRVLHPMRLLKRSVFENRILLQVFCYGEAFNMLVIINRNEEIEAVELGSDSHIWKLSGEVGGHVIKPDALTTDAEGNVYVNDGANNRILKINGSTGDVLQIVFLTEKNTEPIRLLFWSDTEPNLTRIRYDRISTYKILNIY